MALFSFFKAPKHQQFSYKPRFYDPQKERIQQILQSAKGGSDKAELAKSRISGTFQRRAGGYGSTRSQSSKRSNLLLLGIIVLLFALSYILLTVYLPRFIHQIEG